MNRIHVTEQMPYEVKERRASIQLVNIEPNVEMHSGRIYHQDSPQTIHVTLPAGTILTPVDQQTQSNYTRKASLQLHQAPMLVQQFHHTPTIPITHPSAAPYQPVFLHQGNQQQMQQVVYFEDLDQMHMAPVVTAKVVKKAPSVVYRMVPM